jgi:hypothetical protein
MDQLTTHRQEYNEALAFYFADLAEHMREPLIYWDVVAQDGWTPKERDSHTNCDEWSARNPEFRVVRGWVVADATKFSNYSVVEKDGILFNITPPKTQRLYYFVRHPRRGYVTDAEYNLLRSRWPDFLFDNPRPYHKVEPGDSGPFFHGGASGLKQGDTLLPGNLVPGDRGLTRPGHADIFSPEDKEHFSWIRDHVYVTQWVDHASLLSGTNGAVYRVQPLGDLVPVAHCPEYLFKTPRAEVLDVLPPKVLTDDEIHRVLRIHNSQRGAHQ